MRSLLMWVAVAGSVVVSVPARDAAISSADGVAQEGFDLDGSPTPLAERETQAAMPTVRLVALPAGVDDFAIALADADAGAHRLVETGDVMTMRGLRVVPVVVEALGSGTSDVRGTSEAAGGARIEVAYDASTARAAPSPALRFSRGFFDSFNKLLSDGESFVPAGAEEGSYLIITAPLFRPAVEPLAAWKRRMGVEVVVATTDETGLRNSDIREYIADLYHNAAVPPQYVLLVGDVDRLPTWDYHGDVSDHAYTLLDGDDFLPDLDIGRLSVETVSEAETVVAKILGYEQNPSREDGGAWLSRGLVVGANYGNSSAVAVCRWARELMLGIGYTQIDTVYHPPIWTEGVPMIMDAVNAGVSIVAYRGWARGPQGWEPPPFVTDHVYGLTNGWKLPAVFSFVCHNANFGWEDVCFGEAWLRAGSASVPKGGVAFIGNSEHWSHTRHNDAAAIGVFDALAHGERRVGALLNAAKLGILSQFPAEIYYSEHLEESVEFYFYIYLLLGDPQMEIWAAAPRPIQAAHPDTLPLGTNLVEVTVTDPGTGGPVEGARVGITQGDLVLGTAWTDADGIASCLAPVNFITPPITITVTGTGIVPFSGSAEVTAGGPALSYSDADIDDTGGQGNGDGVPNPGETLGLTVWLRNVGTSLAQDVHASVTALTGAVVDMGEVDFPDIPAGGTAAAIQPCVVRLDPRAEDRLEARFRADLTAVGIQGVAGFNLTVGAPVLQYESVAVDGDGVILPGETATLAVTLRNDGSVPASATDATLRTVTPDLVAVVDSMASFDPIPIGGAGAALTSFTVTVGPEVGIGRALGFVLALNSAEGYLSETAFSVTVGSVDHRAPLGPDAYGYYAYDNSDTDYPDAAPLYEWITCSTRYGGSGVKLDFNPDTTAIDTSAVVDLPFRFRFYGKEYERLLVSENGWVSFDSLDCDDFYNWAMPNPYGCGAQIAAFWDNLEPTRVDSAVADGVYALSDTLNRRFVVEWSRLPNRSNELDDVQTFELILYDPTYYPSATGDGVFQIQYKQVVNNDVEKMYATVGIEDEGEDVALQYTYENLYPPAAAPLSAGLALRFTTTPPRYDPFDLAGVSVVSEAGGVRISWEPGDARPRGGYTVYRVLSGGRIECLTPAPLPPHARSFFDETADPAVACIYKIGSRDPVGYETLFGPYAGRDGRARDLSVALAAGSRNPVPGEAVIAYVLPKAIRVRLRIYDPSGRLVRTLADGHAEAGERTAVWDGRDERGHAVPSGVYFCRLDAGEETRRLKLTLVR